MFPRSRARYYRQAGPHNVEVQGPMFQRGKAVHGLAHMCLKIIVWRWLSGVVVMWFKSWCILWAHQVMCVHIIQNRFSWP